MHRVIWIGHPLIDPAQHELELPWVAAQNIGDDLVHLVAPFVHHLMPVHGCASV